MVARFVPTIELYQVLMLEFCEEWDFHVDLLLAGFFDRFDCDILYRLFLTAFVDNRLFASADFFVDVIVVHLNYY